MAHTLSEKSNFPQNTNSFFEDANVQAKIKNIFFKKKDSDQKQSNQYFNKKKKIIIICWFLLFLLLIFFSFRFFSDFTWASLSSTLPKLINKRQFLFIITFGFSIFFVNDCFLASCNYKSRLSNQLLNIKFKDWLSFCIISFFIQSITPFSLGSEPYAIWWLKKKGVKLQEATAIVAVTSLSWFIGQFLITWPSFIYITATNFPAIRNMTIASNYWFILIGLLVDLLIGGIIFLISYCNFVHYFLARCTNAVKRFFDLNCLSNSEIEFKYLLNNTFKLVYLKFLKNKLTLLQIFIFSIQNILIYSLFAKFAILTTDNLTDADFLSAFHIINVSTTANNFLPVPSSEGVLQFTIKGLTPIVMPNFDSPDIPTLFWRFSCKYFGLFISAVYILCFGINPKFTKQVTNKEEYLNTI